MEAIADALKSLKGWQIAFLAALLLVAAAATFGVYTLVGGSDSVALDENQQLIPVRAGDLVNEVSVNGSLVFPTREVLTFGSQGIVADLAIEEGQSVEAGQTLATLDAETIATLGKSVAQARVVLDEAEDALTLALDPVTRLETANAEAAVADADLALRDARDAVEVLLEPDPAAIAEAEAAQVSAQIAWEDALDEYDSALAGPDDDDLTSAFAALDTTNTELSNARRDLKLTEGQWSATIDAGQDSFDAALDEYEAVFLSWLGIALSSEESEVDPSGLLATWQIDLTALFASSQRYNDLGQFLSTDGPSADNPETRWDETRVYLWVNLYPGGILARCEDGLVPEGTSCITEEMDSAWDLLSDARVALDDALINQETATAKAVLAISSAEENVADAREGVDDLTSGLDALELSNLEKQLAVAAAALDEAKTAVADLTGAPDSIDLDAALKDVAVAEAAQAQAREDLAEVREGPDPLRVALRRAEVEAAREALSASIERLARSTMLAPWDGIVSAVGVEVGEAVNGGTAIVEIVDPRIVELDGIVDEIDVLFIRNGAAASVTMDALPGQVLQGSVSAVASAAQNQQGVVRYPILIRLAPPDGVQLPEGLSALASVVIREDNDVLLVPLQSLRGSFDQPAVQVMLDGRLEERAVTLGNSDDFWVVVESGLVEGDMVVMEAESASTGSFFGGGSFRRSSGQFGGNVTGGGFGGGRGFGDHN